MAIGFRSANKGNNGTGASTLAISAPSGVQSGDMLVMGVTARGGTGTTIGLGAYFRGSASLPNYPSALAVDPGGAYYYASSSVGNWIKKIRVSDLTVVSTISTSVTYASNMCVTPDGAWLYCVTSQGSPAYAYVIDLADFTLQTTITLTGGYATNAFSLSDSSRVYVPCGGQNVVKVLRTSDHTFVKDIAVTYAFDWCLTPDDAYIYFPRGNGSQIYKVRTSDDTLVSTLTPTKSNTNGSGPFTAVDAAGVYYYQPNCGIGSDAVTRVTLSNDALTYCTTSITRPQIVRLSPDESLMAVYCQSAADSSRGVVLIRTSDFTEIRATVGDTPDINSLEWDKGGKYLVCPSVNNNKAYVIRASDMKMIREITGLTTPSYAKVNGTEMYFKSGSGLSDVVDAGPLDWELIGKPENSGTTLRQELYWRLAGATEPSAYSAAFNSSVRASGVVVALSGADPSAPLNAQYGGQVNASSTAVDAPSSFGSWEARNGIDVAMLGTAYESSFSPPTDYTEPANGDVASSGTSNATTTAVSYRALTAATSVAAIQGTAANAAVNIGQHVFVKETAPDLSDPTPISVFFGPGQA